MSEKPDAPEESNRALISQEEQDKIRAALSERTHGTCPMCGTRNWMVLGAYSSINAQANPRHMVIGGGKHLPAVSAICSHCGFIALHSAVILGLVDPRG